MKTFLLACILLSLAGCKTAQQRALTYGKTSEQLKSEPNEHLCMDAYLNIDVMSNAAMEELVSRDVNCTPVVRNIVAKAVPTLPATSLCNHVINGNPDEIMTPLANKEIAKRKLDCPAIMQVEYARQGAIAQQNAAAAAQYNAVAQMNAANAMRRPTTTNCTGFGNMVSCNSY